MPTNNPVNEQLLIATRAYLADWADDGHSIIPVEDLIKYGFSGVWLRDLAELHKSGNNFRSQIWVAGKQVDHLMGVSTLDLLEALILELGIGQAELEAAARVEDCELNPMSRGTLSRLYTTAIRAALEKYADNR